jgi:O-antigen/teichoic acid export membrane protein
MSEIINQSLLKITKGAGIVFIGTVVGMCLTLAGRVILARTLTQSEYGIYSLAFVILSVVVVISTLGLQEGATRQIAFYRGKKNEKKVKSVIFSSIELAIFASIFLSLILFFTSDFISAIFHIPDLSMPLKIFSAAIPFTVLVNIFVTIFRGFDLVKPRVYFQEILRNLLFVLFLITVVILGLSFMEIFYVYVVSLMLTCIAFAVYTIKKLPLSIYPIKKVDRDTKVIRRDLLVFSLPLLAVTVLVMMMTWTDTLMLGYFKTPDLVGLYNVAIPISQLLPIFLYSTAFIYIPIASGMFSQNLKDELRKSYAVLTKWVFSATLPFFLIIFLFPDAVLNILFGPKYIGASEALRILSLGMFVHTFLGANGATLIVTGKTRLHMVDDLIAVIINILLNTLLIPKIGITGAAIASTTSLVITNMLRSAQIYIPYKIHPFSKNYLKLALISIVSISIVYSLTRNLIIVSTWSLLTLFIVFLGIYGLLSILTKSFDKEDIMILHTIEHKLGMNLRWLKKILRRFV